MANDPVSISRLFEFFELGSLVEGATKHKCRTAVRKFVALFGDVHADCVTGPMVGQWQVWMRDQQAMSVASVRSYCAAASQVFTWGVEAGLITNRIWKQAKRIKPPRREVSVFNDSELADLVDAAATMEFRDPLARLRWTGIIQLACSSGMRLGEILNTRWDDVDLDGRLIWVRYRPDRWPDFWTWGAKGKTDRPAPMSQLALEVFTRLAEVAPWRYPLLPQARCLWLQQRVGAIPEVVRKMPCWNIHRTWKRIRIVADGVRRCQNLAPLKNGGLHQCRKTAVTSWARQGVPLLDAQVVAGHQSAATTRTYYIASDALASVSRVQAAIDAKKGL